MVKNWLKNKRAGIAFLEVFILIVSIFAIAWIVYQSTSLIGMARAQDQVQEPQYRTDFNPSLTENVISDEEKSWSCCPQTDSGAICQDVVPEYENCSSSLIPSQCQNVVGCQEGCCYDPDEGLCSPQATKHECESNGGNWSESPSCQIPECQKGCCVLGSETQFVTESRCQRLTNFSGFESFDFRSNINTELECLSLANQQKEGACVINSEGQNGCEFITKRECLEKTGSSLNFKENKLCTHPDLNTSCRPTNKTRCEGEKVYWVDSCGNLANIYDASKVNSEEYWSRKMGVNESCSSNSGNIGSKTCGNCNRFLGSSCGRAEDIEPEYGDKICKDLNCKDAPDVVDAQGNILSRKDRRNGESWCVYDSKIGQGRDTVGSRHWKYYCSEGEVKIEPCQDYRQEICVESVTANNNTGKSLSQASCRINRWRECIQYNDLAEKRGEEVYYGKMIKKCKDNVDCFVKEMDFGDKYHLYQCLPQYPGGFSLDSERGEVNKKLCALGNFKCTKIEVKEIGGWECVAGCDCDSEEYTQQMNDWCRSLGDCGGYVNIVGREDHAYSSDSGSISLGQYKKNLEPTVGQKADPGDISDILKGQLGLETGEEGYIPRSSAGKLGKFMGRIGGATAGIVWRAGGFSEALTFSETIANAIGGGVELAAFGSAALGAAAGAVVGYIAIEMFGLQGDAALVTMALSIVGGIVGGLLLGAELGALLGGVIGAVIGAIIGVVLSLVFGWGDTKETDYSFRCYPWQAPTGGEDCSKCGAGQKECSEYRCNSLGQACELINKGTSSQKCIWQNPDDSSSPQIGPWNEALSENYTYQEETRGMKIREEDGECIQAYTPIQFGIKTDEESQCKFSFVEKPYEEMENYFGLDNLYRENHSMPYTIPHPSAFSSQFNISYEHAFDKIGSQQLYVKCQDVNGNKNVDPYVVDICIAPGPDLTAPEVIKEVPNSGSYLKFNETEKEVKLYINEPAECKYSLEDKKFAEMNNSMECVTSLTGSGQYGWPCLSTLNVSNNSQFYFRCKDQPWLEGENESKRNANQGSFPYEFKLTREKLNITRIEPSGKITVGGINFFSEELRVVTSGGSEEGRSICRYGFKEGEFIDQMEPHNIYSRSHEQPFNWLGEGKHTIYVKCEDRAGNVVKENTEFRLNIDNNFPSVVRAYQEGGLKIITNEDSTCKYSNENCNFLWENATEMSGMQKVHSSGVEEGKVHYVKCRDIWGNEPDGCSIIVKTV